MTMAVLTSTLKARSNPAVSRQDRALAVAAACWLAAAALFGLTTVVLGGAGGAWLDAFAALIARL